MCCLVLFVRFCAWSYCILCHVWLMTLGGLFFPPGRNVSWGRGEVLEELGDEEGRKAVVEMYCVREE